MSNQKIVLALKPNSTNIVPNKKIINMKNLKSILFASLLSIGTFAAVLVSSCNPDKCADIICVNGGSCADGNCSCPSGYEGTLCETETRAKFKKLWAANDNDNSAPSNNYLYSCLIADGSGPYGLLIQNTFAGDFFINNITAIASANVINIPQQEPDLDGYKVAGTGNFSSTTNKISWNYSITETSTGDVITYTGTWQ